MTYDENDDDQNFKSNKHASEKLKVIFSKMGTIPLITPSL